MKGATLDDLNLQRFQLEYLPVAVSPEALAENQRTLEHQLRALRLVHPDGTPTVTAILIHGAPVRVTWFADRIEIQSPGGPYGQVTRASFGTPGVADYRNPTIAEALKSLGFIERFGVGIAIARDRLAANGNPPLEFTVEDAHILATVRQRR